MTSTIGSQTKEDKKAFHKTGITGVKRRKDGLKNRYGMWRSKQSIYNTCSHRCLVQIYGEDVIPPCKRCQRFHLRCRSWITQRKQPSKTCSECKQKNGKCLPGVASDAETPTPTTPAAALSNPPAAPTTRKPEPRAKGKATAKAEMLQEDDTGKSMYHTLS
jgi:hypothetical protein